jgi:T-complex protein 1 subunit beta
MFVGAIALADLVKTTLGPKGMDKILKSMGAGPKSDKIIITNDGATILGSVHIDNAAAKILIGNLKSPKTSPRLRTKKSEMAQLLYVFLLVSC